MGIINGIKNSFSSALNSTKSTVIGRVTSLIPSFRPSSMNYLVDRKIQDAEARIMQAVAIKLQGRGIMNAEAKIMQALQNEVDAAVGALIDNTPSLNLPSLSLGTNPVALASIGGQLASMKGRILSNIALQFNPSPSQMQGMVNRAAANMGSMVGAALESKLASHDVTLNVESALSQHIDRLIDPIVDEIVDAVAEFPEIQLPF